MAIEKMSPSLDQFVSQIFVISKKDTAQCSIWNHCWISSSKSISRWSFKPKGVLFKLSSLGASLKEYLVHSKRMSTCVSWNAWGSMRRRHCMEFQNPCPCMRYQIHSSSPMFVYIRQSPHREFPTGLVSYYCWQDHLVRGALTSAAVAKGIHVVDILAVADWSGVPPSRGFIIDPSQRMTMHKRSQAADWL